MTPFGITAPGRILFGRGVVSQAAGLITTFGPRGIVVHGRDPRQAAGLIAELERGGVSVSAVACAHEPDLPLLKQCLTDLRHVSPDWVVAMGGGAVLDMGKALAALIPQTTPPMDHLEGVGRGLPLGHAPLPFIAIPTTAGTGAEATTNAVIGVPDHARKVSLRDIRMMARLAIVDPALTDGCPRGVTLASGLDAITQVIEPFVSCRASPFTDALCRPAIGDGLAALQCLIQGEDSAARDRMAWVSLRGGLALANAGLGAVHGIAGVIGGRTGAAHGAICGALLGPVLAMNRRLASAGSDAAGRLAQVCEILGAGLRCDADSAPAALADWARQAGLPGLGTMGVAVGDLDAIADAALGASSTRGNPVSVTTADLSATMEAAL